MKLRVFTPTERQQRAITKRYLNYEDLAAIGASYGVSSECIRYKLVAWGVPKRVKVRSIDMTDAHVKQACKMRKQGASVSDISATLGFSQVTICTCLRNAGFEVNVRKFTKREALLEHASYLQGLTTSKELGEKYGCTSTSVLATFKRAGLKVLTISESKRIGTTKLRAALGITTEMSSNYSAYRDLSRALTKSNLLRYASIIDPKNKRGKHYHIDHKLSVYDGYYKSKLPAALIAHPANLQIVKARYNLQKSKESVIDAKQLRKEIAAWNLAHGNPY